MATESPITSPPTGTPSTSTTTTTTTTASTTIPTTTPKTTVSPPSATTTQAMTTAEPTTDVTTTTTVEVTTTNITTLNKTLGREMTYATSAEMSATYVVLAIAFSVVACVIIILVICFVTYRRGIRSKRRMKEHIHIDSRVTPKNLRVNGPQQPAAVRLSAIGENGQSTSGALACDQSEKNKRESIQPSSKDNGSEDVKRKSDQINLPPAMASNDGKDGHITSNEIPEPQYANIVETRVRSNPTDNCTDSAAYINLSEPPESFGTVQAKQALNSVDPDINQSGTTGGVETGESFYENVASSAQYDESDQKEAQKVQAIYQNTAQQNNDENIYEQPIKSDIYVDMQ